MLFCALLLACFAAVSANAEDFGSVLFNITDGTGARGQVQYCQTYPLIAGWIGTTPKAVEITADCSDWWFSNRCPVFGKLDVKTATNGSAYGMDWNYLAWTVDLPAGTNFSIRINTTHGSGSGFGGYVVPPKGPNPTCNQTLLHRAFEADSMGANYTGTRENQVKVSSAVGTIVGGGWGVGAAVVMGALGLVLL